MERIHKATMLKQVRDRGEWTGYLSPSNVNGMHINTGWNCGIHINVCKDGDKYLVVKDDGQNMELEDYINNFKFYNCNPELGQDVRFWQEV